MFLAHKSAKSIICNPRNRKSMLNADLSIRSHGFDDSNDPRSQLYTRTHLVPKIGTHTRVPIPEPAPIGTRWAPACFQFQVSIFIPISCIQVSLLSLSTHKKFLTNKLQFKTFNYPYSYPSTQLGTHTRIHVPILVDLVSI